MKRCTVPDAYPAAPPRRRPNAPRGPLLLSLVACLMLAASPAANARGEAVREGAAEPLLPDLRALPPSGFYIVPADDGGVVRLKFSTVIWNAGPGILEVRGRASGAAERLEVYQVFYTADGELVEGGAVGSFDFEHRHGHLHLSDFARYELWSAAEDGSLRELVAENEKVGFCLMDNILIESELTLGDGDPRYPTDCEGDVQGISPGYGDVYVAQLYEQDIDVTGLPDGRYAVVNVANPSGTLAEVTLENNRSVALIRLEGERVRPD